MKTSPNQNSDYAMTEFYDAIFDIATDVADTVNPETDIIENEWAVYDALERIEMSGRRSAPKREVRKLAIQIARDEKKIADLEAEGMTRSDAQAVLEAQEVK